MTSRPSLFGCCLLLLLTLGVDFADAGTPFSSEEKQALVDRQNEIRREVGASDMNYLDWDDGLARNAQEVADQCVFVHANDGVSVGEFEQIGENFYAHGGEEGEPKTGLDATNYWYEEKEDYTYADNSCADVCGHYTQITWAKSRRVGCGRNFCPTMQDGMDNAWFIVCNYGPAGNVQGQKPWQEGAPCTKCDSGSGQCFDGLCRPCSEHSEACECKMECQNCGELDDECRCSCPNGFTAPDCSEVCEDKHEQCGANPGWPDENSCTLFDMVPVHCPLMCGVCNAQDEDFVCEPGQTGSGRDRDRETPTEVEPTRSPPSTGGGGGGGRKGGICQQAFTAATYVDDMLYLFHGGKLWKVTSSGELQSPVTGENAQDSFTKLPDDISAVYQRGDGNVVFLRENKMFIFQGNKRIDGHPIKLDQWGVETDIAGAAFNTERNKAYFFKGPQVWRYDEAAKRLDKGYPKSTAEEFDEKVNKPKLVFSDPEGNIFFVKNSKVFRISSGRKRVDDGYPKPFAKEFFADC